MRKEYEYDIHCEGFEEFENWKGKVDGVQVSFRREIQWDYAGYELTINKRLDMNPQDFHEMFCQANGLQEKDIEVKWVYDEEANSFGLQVRGKNIRLEAPLYFSVVSDDWSEPSFSGGRELEPTLPKDLPESVKNKILEACKESGWSPLEAIGLDAEHNGVDRTMTGFTIWKAPNDF